MKRYLPFVTLLLLTFTIMPDFLFAQVEYDNTGLTTWLNDYGRIRLYSPGEGGLQQVERISVLVGGAANQVFDYQNDQENESPAVIVASPTLSDWEFFVSTNNTYSNLPPNYKVDINIYGWAESPYVLVKYTVTNNETTAMNATLGITFISALDELYGGEVVAYNSEAQTILWSRDGASTAVGVFPLSHDLVTLKSIDWYEDYYSSDTDLYGWLTTGTVEATFDQCPNGPVTFIGFGNANIAAGASTSFWIAVALASDTQGVLNWITDAQTRYDNMVSSVELTDEIPTDYNLSQNYPNPFNPTTKINFSIPESNFVSLKVYNALGQEVVELVSEELNAGSYSVDFDASSLSSGLYMYKLTSANFSLTKKMLLVK